MLSKKRTLIANDLVAGILSGFVLVILVIAFSALIFKGQLGVYLSIGLCCAITSSFVSNFINVTMGSIPFSIARLEPAVAAILSIIFAHISASIVPESSLFSTLIITIMLVSLLTGFSMFFIGYFQFGQIIRFVPYPVLGGVIVGSALIMARSSFSLVSNNHSSFEYLTQAHSLLQLGISFGFALFLLVFKRLWMLPFHLIILSLVVTASLHFAQIPTEKAVNLGWLFSSFTPTFIFNTFNFSLFTQVDWMVIANQSGYIFGLLSLIIILFLLNIGGVETTEKIDANLDQELKSAGLANIVGGFFFAFPCCLSLSGTLLNRNIGATSRLSGMIAAIISILMLFYPGILSYVPIPVIGGLLLFIAFKLVLEWVYEGWYQLPRSEYLILISIALIISMWSFLSGTFIGILTTCMLFIYNYTKIDASKYFATGENYHSNVIRSISEQKWLSEQGHKILLFKLQGYLFFGSTKLLLDQVSRLFAEKKNAYQFLIFDFHWVTGLDSSANFNFIRLQQRLHAKKMHLVFTDCSPAVIEQLKKQKVINQTFPLQLFSDLDEGLEWCENNLLQSLPKASKTDSLSQLIPDKKQLAIFVHYLKQFDLKAKDFLFKQGEQSKSLYFIRSGEISIFLTKNKNRIRLAKSGAGTIIGEIGFYLEIPRTATIFAEESCTVYELTQEQMSNLEQAHPEIALMFHKNIIQLLAKRLTQANYLLEINLV